MLQEGPNQKAQDDYWGFSKPPCFIFLCNNEAIMVFIVDGSGRYNATCLLSTIWSLSNPCQKALKQLKRLDQSHLFLVQQCTNHNSFCQVFFFFWPKVTFWFNFNCGSFKCSIFIGPESDHWLCLSLTNSLTDSLTNSLLFSKLD